MIKGEKIAAGGENPIENTSGSMPGHKQKVEGITMDDLQLEIPERGETVIVLQCNARDNRDPKSPHEMGALLPEAAEALRKHTKESLHELLALLNEDEKKSVHFLVVAGDSVLGALEPELRSPHKRAGESAEQIIAAIQECMRDFSLEKTQLLNKSGKPIELTSGKLRDLKMFDDSPQFVQFLKDKYGTQQEFWRAFERDTEQEARKTMGAEGPREIAERIKGYLGLLARAMQGYHKFHPGERVIVWAVSHYDTISPFVKSQTGMQATDYLPVEKGAGIVIRLQKDQKATTTIGRAPYELSL